MILITGTDMKSILILARMFMRIFWTIMAVMVLVSSGIAWADPQPGDLFREYGWSPERCHVLGLEEKPFDIPCEFDLVDATKAEIVIEIASQHLGFEGMAIRLNGNQWYPIRYPESTPKEPSPSVWFHHWYQTIPVSLSDLKSGAGNNFEMKAPPEPFDGQVHPIGKVTEEHPLGEWGLLKPFFPVYGVTIRVYYDPLRKPHATGKVIAPIAESTIGLSVHLKASVKSDNAKISQIDFVGRYEDINYEGDGIYRQWHYHLFHGRITHHLGSTSHIDSTVVWDTSWIPDQPSALDIAARITDSTGLIYMTESVGGLKLSRPGLSVELCKPYEVPGCFTSCPWGEIGNPYFSWVAAFSRSEKFMVKGDLSKIIDARYVIASWGNLKECPGYKINDVLLNDKPEGDNWFYNLSMPPIRPLSALKAGENTFSTIGGQGHMPDIYMPGVQILIQYRTNGKAESLNRD